MHWRGERQRETERDRDRERDRERTTEQGESVTDEVAKRLITIIK
jgi:hypothetical protein